MSKKVLFGPWLPIRQMSDPDWWKVSIWHKKEWREKNTPSHSPSEAFPATPMGDRSSQKGGF